MLDKYWFECIVKQSFNLQKGAKVEEYQGTWIGDDQNFPNSLFNFNKKYLYYGYVIASNSGFTDLLILTLDNFLVTFGTGSGLPQINVPILFSNIKSTSPETITFYGYRIEVNGGIDVSVFP